MTDYQTQQRRRNMVVGVFVLLAFAAFIWMLVKFHNLPLLASHFKSFLVFVEFPETPGIQPDTTVNYCGYPVGRVMKVDPPKKTANEVERKPYHSVRVTIAIDKKFSDIPDHAEFQIVKRGLGSSFIEINVDPDKPVSGYLTMGTTKYGSLSTASEFFPPNIQKKLEDLVDSITALSQNANSIIGDSDNKTNIKKTLENVTLATSQAAGMLQSIEQFADLGTERLNAAATKLDATLESFRHLSEIGAEQIETVALSLDATLREFRDVMAKLQSGPGAAAKFINDGRLYENLLDSSKQLELALDQIKKWAADAREKGIRIKW